MQANQNKHCADYVIIGVGTSGGLLAKKLSDNCKNSVIALQNGKNLTDDPLIKFSEGAEITVPALLVGPPLYMNQPTVPQVFANDRELICGNSIIAGGASSINAGVYCLGTDEFYDEWESFGGPNWSAKRIKALFKRLETYRGKTTNPQAHGKRGPLIVLQVSHPPKVSRVFTDAMVIGTGVPEVLDYNDTRDGVTGACSRVQFTQTGKKGQFRESSMTAFLDDSVVTPNGRGVGRRKLRILFEAMALKTLWDGNKAIGVEYLHKGTVKKVFAKKGVIVCGGLKSSTFLLHSGVGPRNVLEPLGIPVIVDNPNVGQNLTDQPAVRVVFSTNPFDYSLVFKGLIGNIASCPAPGGDPNQRKIRLAIIAPVPGLALCTCDLYQPKSVGSISINSSNPLADPVIDLGILSNPEDLQLFMQALQVYIKNINLALQEIDPAYSLIFPDPAILDDPIAVEAFIRENVNTNEHFQSHCRMGSLEQGGVVDGTGHVHGAENLIVCDCSIIPICMNGSPMSFAYLCAENIAELLLSQKRD